MFIISNGIDIGYQLMDNLYIIMPWWEEKMQIFRQSFWSQKAFLPDVSDYQHQSSVPLGYLNLDVSNLNHAEE